MIPPSPANCSIKIFKALSVLVVLATALKISAAPSQWVYLNSSNHLEYKTLPQGDRIMDFSYAGYGGGGVSIPGVPAAITVSPLGGDDTTNIQNAIDAVSRMPLTNGFRGAVLLGKGIFYCSGLLTIKARGVVLRGYGTGVPGTMIRMTSAPHVGISIEGAALEESGERIPITDKYVPSGAVSFHVADGSSFKPGDEIFIFRPATPAWITFMGMNDLLHSAKREQWVGDTVTRRTVTTVSGNTIMLDVPLSDSFDSQYLNPPGAWVAHSSTSGWVHEVGVENLRIMSPAQATSLNQKSYRAININNASDVWVRNVAMEDPINGIHTGANTSRITIKDVVIKHTVATAGTMLPTDFIVDGTQTLLVHCSAIGNNVFYFATLSGAAGPNVLFNCDFSGNGSISPHERWATGLLFDNCRVNGGSIDLMNRGEVGSGHGWTSGWCVAWNCVAKNYTIQQPPGAANWAIGCTGEQDLAPMPFGNGPMLPQGMIESADQPVDPASLYLEQLSERLGDKMVMP